MNGQITLLSTEQYHMLDEVVQVQRLVVNVTN